jgi:glycosyltransferase involved in cell wall biosynthesis
MEVCLRLGQKYPSIRYFRQPQNIGVMQNFDFVLQQARGEFFMWLSDDDFLEPGILQRYAHFLAAHPDYSLVSGRIRYWIGEQPIFCEQDFNLERRSGIARLLNFYFRVVYGSIFYGLMRREIAKGIPIKNRIGDDWHFVASLAYMGKIKNLECIGYNKKCGGLSKDFQQYAKTMGAAPFSARYPHVQIALDAFSNIFYDSPVFAKHHAIRKIFLGACSFVSILLSFYVRQYPFIIGGKVKRLMHLPTSGTRRLVSRKIHS